MLSSVALLPNQISIAASLLGVKSEHIKAFIPIWIEGLLDHCSRSSLLSTDSGHSERVRESCNDKVLVRTSNRSTMAELAEDIAFIETISGDDCYVSVHGI